MDLTEIKNLIELAKESGINELEVAEKTGEGKKHIRIVVASATSPAPAAVATPSAQAETPSPPPLEETGNAVVAPLSGTFYRAPAPGEPPFVKVGDRVAVGDALCIIESMKMMNRVRSEQAGEVAAVLVENGQAIETGTALFRLV